MEIGDISQNVSANCQVAWNWTFSAHLTETHMPLAQAVDRYVTPVWYLIGLVGNILSVHVWLRIKSKGDNTSVLYLVSLAIADLILIAFHIVQELKVAWGYPTTDHALFCEAFNALYMIPQYLSPMLVLGFTVERFISITKPFRSERFSRHKRSTKEIAAIAMFTIMLAAPMAYLWIYNGKECLGRITLFGEVWIWITEMAMFGGVPIITLVLNVFVLRYAKSAERIRRESTTEASLEPRHHSSRMRKSHVSTVTLLWVSFYRIFTLLPVTIMYVLQSVIQVPDEAFCLTSAERSANPMWQRYFLYITLRRCIQEFGFSHHACNVFIYCSTSPPFRKQLTRTIRGLIPCLEKKRLSNSSTFNSHSTMNTTSHNKDTKSSTRL